mgnify:FL=1
MNFIGNGDALNVDLRVGNGAEYEYLTYRLKPSGSEPLKYLALGDSFSSGEGAFDYRSPTDFYIDESSYNLCHLSKNAYPYLIQRSQNFEWFNSVACSGARVEDLSSQDSLEYLKGRSQAKTDQKDVTQVRNALENLIPGYIPQIKFNDLYHPSIATVSVGGNDFGFGKIIEKCVIGGGDNDILCYLNRDEREKLANSIENKIPELAVLFSQLQSSLSGSNPELFVVGYPEIISPNGNCGLNVAMQPTETVFTEHLTRFMNEAIRTAARRAGVNYVDVAKAFVNNGGDHRLCGDSEQYAVNGLMLKSETSKKPDRIAHPESYHPNQLGQSLLAATILQSTNNLTLQAPEADSSATMPQSSRVDLVGDAEIRYPNYDIKLAEEISPDTIFKDDQLNINLRLSPGDERPSQGSDIRLEIHSEPIRLGGLQFSSGTINGTVTIPNNLSAGYHELHIIYEDIQGSSVDLYKHVYVANSRSDFDGDGADNDSDPCSILIQSGVDQDDDDIDDSCDGEYVQSPGSMPVSYPAKNSTYGNTMNQSKRTFALVGLSDRTAEVEDMFQTPATVSIMPEKNLKDIARAGEVQENHKDQEDNELANLTRLAIAGAVTVFVIIGMHLRRKSS